MSFPSRSRIDMIAPYCLVAAWMSVAIGNMFIVSIDDIDTRRPLVVVSYVAFAIAVAVTVRVAWQVRRDILRADKIIAEHDAKRNET